MSGGRGLGQTQRLPATRQRRLCQPAGENHEGEHAGRELHAQSGEDHGLLLVIHREGLSGARSSSASMCWRSAVPFNHARNP
jgi:hypothetical protein